MPPQRAPSQTSTSQNGNSKSRPPKTSRPVSTGPLPPNQKPDFGMSPTSRYDHNLKVLRRRDPSITTIFDQFSHVCVYHFNINTNKWEKLGYEGSMFLYERNEYPPYGFYVLNRQGMDDYIQRMQPDDDIGEVGGYVMLRSYPDFTRRRLAAIHEQHPLEAPPPFDDAYRLPSPGPTKLEKEAESSYKTVGLWVFASDAREPLCDVMRRLHSYIRKNERYPEEYRYGPGRPPPPNPHLRTTPASPTVPHSTANTIRPSASSHAHNGSTPEFNQLVAKLNSSVNVQQTPSRMAMTVETLFATIGKTPNVNGISKPTPPPQTPKTGIPLLDSIFASAVPSGLQPPAQAEPIIHSPKPSTNTLPQILNQDVIYNLLGLPSSRSSSTNSASSSPVDDSEMCSESSTVFDFEAEPDAAGASAGRPLMSREFVSETLGLIDPAPVNGDVTPRAPGSSLSYIPLPPTIESTVRPSPPQALLVPLNEKSNGRRLVPFDDADSQLWPYPRAPIDEDEEELVQLDFRDTSALSDSDKFRREEVRARRRTADDSASASGSELGRKEKNKGGKKNRKKRDAKERAEIEKSWDLPEAIVPASVPVTPAAIHSTTTTPSTARPHVNGTGKAHMNGNTHPASRLDPVAVRESILDSISSPALIEKNDFVREVLNLIHTDKTFVDSLWKDYLARTH
ncbi:hypothetical protein CPB85DRAFT_1430069 [Mucidula mucida]|nr:hypothetical protein CPB85DRAFT_1430069 [Mucidula mucida]